MAFVVTGGSIGRSGGVAARRAAQCSARRVAQARSIRSTVRACAEGSAEPDANSTEETSTTTAAPSSVPKPVIPKGFSPPEPKTFMVRPSQLLEIVGGSLGSAMRGYTGALVSGYSAGIKDGAIVESSTNLPEKRPIQPLQVFEFEACPFCRKVREALTILDLEAYFYPCPKGGQRFRPLAEQMGGKALFPYLIDPNTDFAGYESTELVKYLFQTYGDGNVPLTLNLGQVTDVSSGFATLFRGSRGGKRAGSKLVYPELPLELWSYEPSPFCKVVREALCELELPYLLHNTARGSPQRAVLKERVGRFQVPYLEDPNTGVNMFESGEIVKYLYEVYGESAPGAQESVPAELALKMPVLPVAKAE